jgi:CRISPR-associated protein Cas6
LNTTVDVRWPIHKASRIPLHHQYQLLSAIAGLIPAVHHRNSLGIHPILGMHVEPGFLYMTKTSALTIRAPVDQLPMLLVLNGKRLDLGGFPIRLGVPQVLSLLSSRRVTSHLVTIKGYKEIDTFAFGVRRQMDAAAISPSVNVHLGPRRILRIKNRPSWDSRSNSMG